MHFDMRFSFVKINALLCFLNGFNSISRYLDDLLNFDNPYFEQMVGQIYLLNFSLIRRILLIL